MCTSMHHHRIRGDSCGWAVWFVVPQSALGTHPICVLIATATRFPGILGSSLTIWGSKSKKTVWCIFMGDGDSRFSRLRWLFRGDWCFIMTALGFPTADLWLAYERNHYIHLRISEKLLTALHITGTALKTLVVHACLAPDFRDRGRSASK
ncbi:hypothetical protein BDR03DRAFT_386743 [Suillus americanus]|nr:hypothetical protein BDR03DRAFT_386743 [Suillus americanus]